MSKISFVKYDLPKDGYNYLLARETRKDGKAYWLKWDDTACVWELYETEDGDGYSGAFDYIVEAKLYVSNLYPKA